MFKLNAKFDADSLLFSLSPIECKATQYTCSLSGIYCPHWLAQWSCHCHAHCSPLSLAVRLYWHCTNCPQYVNNGRTFSRQTMKNLGCFYRTSSFYVSLIGWTKREIFFVVEEGEWVRTIIISHSSLSLRCTALYVYDISHVNNRKKKKRAYRKTQDLVLANPSTTCASILTEKSPCTLGNLISLLYVSLKAELQYPCTRVLSFTFLSSCFLVPICPFYY